MIERFGRATPVHPVWHYLPSPRPSLLSCITRLVGALITVPIFFILQLPGLEMGDPAKVKGLYKVNIHARPHF